MAGGVDNSTAGPALTLVWVQRAQPLCLLSHECPLSPGTLVTRKPLALEDTSEHGTPSPPISSFLSGVPTCSFCSCPQPYSGELACGPLEKNFHEGKSVCSVQSPCSPKHPAQHYIHGELCTCHLMPWLREQKSDKWAQSLVLPLLWYVILIEMGPQTTPLLDRLHIYSIKLDFNFLIIRLPWLLSLSLVLWEEKSKSEKNTWSLPLSNLKLKTGASTFSCKGPESKSFSVFASQIVLVVTTQH